MSADESAAFEEFLFNMTSEELATLRREMQKQHLSAASPAWAAEVLGRQIEELEHAHEIDPMALYRKLPAPPARRGLPPAVECTRPAAHRRGLPHGLPARPAVIVRGR